LASINSAVTLEVEVPLSMTVVVAVLSEDIEGEIVFGINVTLAV
jgi:hypothetical protein